MDRIKKALLPIYVYVPIDIKRLFRDKVAIFFVFLFPLIFLFIFGNIFSGNSDVSFRIGIINQSDSEFSKQFAAQLKDNKIFKVDDEITSLETAEEKMNRGQVDATVVLPTGFGDISEAGYPAGQAKIVYNQSNESAAGTLRSVLEGVFKEVNNGIVPSVTPFTVTSESTNTKGLRQFDYTFTGLLGFTMLSLGVFGPISTFPRLKQKGVLRRYELTTLKVWQYFVGNVLSNGFVGLLSVAVMFVTALTAFDLNMQGNYLVLTLMAFIGTTLMFGIGLAVGGWARTENQAAPLGQVVTMPMMFLSGVFFPTFLMPEWLQNISRFIPLTPIVDSMRLIVTENAGLMDLGPQLAIMGGWMVVIYLIAFRVFRWE